MSDVAFRKIQVGKEATRGTAVPANEKIIGTLTMTPERTQHRPVDDLGSLAEHSRTVTIGQKTSAEFRGSLIYQQAMHWLAMSMKGAVEPASSTAGFAKWDDNSIFADMPNTIDDTPAEQNFTLFTAAEDKIYVGVVAAKFRGVKFEVGTTPNAAVSVITTVEVSDGASGWVAATLIKDTTKSAAGASLAQDGIVEFTIPSTWASDTVDGNAAFWVRFTWDVNWTANADIDEIDTVPLAAVWTYTPNLTTKNVQDSYTLEFGDDTQGWECPFTLADSFEMSGAGDEAVEARLNLFGQGASKVTLTPSIDDLPLATDVVFGDMKVYIDGTWATLGTTVKSTLVSGFTIGIPSTGLSPIKTADGTLNFSLVAERKRHMEITMEMLVGTDAITEFDAWNKAVPDARAVRIEFIGPVIDGADTHKLTVDMIGKYTQAPQLFGEREGGNVMSMMLSSEPDTSNNEMSIVLITDRAAA